jgi:prophage regulatory protein
MSIYRISVVKNIIGLCRSSIYNQISQGIFPKPISIGARAVGWIDFEIQAIVDARINGKSDNEIKAIVSEFHISNPKRFSSINHNLMIGKVKMINGMPSRERKARHGKVK